MRYIHLFENFSKSLKPNPLEDLVFMLRTGDLDRIKLSEFIENSLDLYETYLGYNLLHWAAWYDKGDIIKMLVKYGLDVNHSAPGIGSALHIAVAKNSNNAAHALLECGADVNMKNAYGDTPLHLAAHSGNVILLQMLLDHGADKEMKNDSGKLPWDLLLRFKDIHPKIIQRFDTLRPVSKV